MAGVETGLMPYAAPQVEEYRARIVMTPDDAKALDAQLRACTLAVLRAEVDYGTIAGTDDRKVLFKPGAEKLLQWFGLVYTCDRVEVEHDSDGRKEGVTYRATISKQLPDGRIIPVASCEGYAGYDEGKFFQSAEQAQAKAKAKERSWAEKDGRPPNPNRWNQITEYRAPWNTVIKMAQKRALVGATVDATAAAGLFSAEDGDEVSRAPEPDDGPSLGEQLLGEAATFTTKAAFDRIWRESATAAREGLCTPGQATHIQNRLRVRLKTLTQAAQPVYVDDLARQAAKDASPAEDAPHPIPRAEPAEEAPNRPAMATGGQAGIIDSEFERLGWNLTDPDDRESQLINLAKLARIGDITAVNQLPQDKAAEIITCLRKCGTADELTGLTEDGEVPGDA